MGGELALLRWRLLSPDAAGSVTAEPALSFEERRDGRRLVRCARDWRVAVYMSPRISSSRSIVAGSPSAPSVVIG